MVPAPANMPQKRKSEEAGLADPVRTTAPKLRAREIVHHQLRYRQQAAIQSSSVLRQEHCELQLERSIAVALDAVGFEDADVKALAQFRHLIEEYMHGFTRSVHRSMVAGRRRTTIPQDFTYALENHHLTLRSLIPHLSPPVYDGSTARHPILSSKSAIQPPLSSQPVESDTDFQQLDLIGHVLSSSAKAKQQQHIFPSSFPALPSEHTYKDNPVYMARERDPQKIREQATEEGRLGEEALRRLAGKKPDIKVENKKLFRQRAQDMWAAVMESVEKDVEGSGSGGPAGASTGMLSGPVNAESVYWRKPVKGHAAAIKS